MTAITGEAFNAMRIAHNRAIGTADNSVFPVEGMRPWQVASLRKLAEFDALAPNWDSYGSDPVNEDALRIARALAGSTFVAAPTPRIVPVSGGGIHFTWERGVRAITLEIQPDQAIEILAISGDDMKESPPLRALSPTILAKLLTWLNG